MKRDLSITIGGIKLENNVFLAPMAGITDMPFRVICKEQGCGLAYTEMISANGLHYGSRESFELSRISGEEIPTVVQIFGSDPERMAEAARLLEDCGASMIDINMGCPTPKIVKNGDGCALMRDPDLAGRIVKAVSLSTNKPVTVKIRKGWDGQNVNAAEIAVIAAYNGASAITVHGRTRDQYYSGQADWEIIKQVRQAVSIPVIGNGDIFSPEDARRMMDETGCNAVMIGRGALGNPWIFAKTIAYLTEGRHVPDLSNEQKTEIVRRHFNLLLELRGEYRAVLEMRKHLAWYCKGLKHATKLKQMAFQSRSATDIENVLREIF